MVIQFDYHGTTRIVEPQAHGISSAGNEIIRGVQNSPYGTFGKPIEGKLYRIALGSSIELNSWLAIAREKKAHLRY